MQKQKQNYSWYKLDNAAKIYPATGKRNWNSTFRLSAVFKEEISPEILEKAVDDLKLRFPTFFVQLRMGLFWYYFEPTISSHIVSEEKHYPCSPIEIGHSELPIFRVLYYKRKVSLEVYHAVADGSGAMVFMKALIAHYLHLCGYDVDDARWEIKDPRGKAVSAEIEDSFEKYYKTPEKIKRYEPKAHKYKPPKGVNENYLRIISGNVNAEKLRLLAKRYKVTITQYLTALYIWSFAQTLPAHKFKRPIRISVPVNLRRLFPSETLRNFSLYVNVGVMTDTPKEIENILEEILPQLEKGLSKEALLQAFSKNVAPEKNALMRLSPIFIKNIALRIAFSLWGEKRYTSALSNMGIITLPESMSQHVEEMQFVLGCSPSIALNLAVLTYKGKATITFSSRTQESQIQSIFFNELTKQGLEVEVESNE